MNKIIRGKEILTSKERIQRTFAFEDVDRVALGYDTNPVAHENLCKVLNLDSKDRNAFNKHLGIDHMGARIKYNGPKIYEDVPQRTRNSEHGAITKYVQNQFGAYWDFCDFPLEDADDDVIYNYPYPSADDYDYKACADYVDYLVKEGFAIHVGDPGLGDILNTTGMIMGVEQALINIATEHEPTIHTIDKRLNLQLKRTEKILEMNKGKIDFMWLGEDLGTQHTPMISMELYRKVLKPRHQKFIDLAKSFNLPVIIHTCGSSSWVYEEFIEMGMNGVDTLQPEAVNMSPEYLVEHFGGRLVFRGCISTAGPLAYGTQKETERVCIDTLEIMSKCKGYIFAPTHSIQDNTPPENTITMYNTAYSFKKGGSK
ncbi:MAG TPA: uroporphyrinogen decarboxylase family protein [Clostridia bacterium]|nr:uroporphyrinogen decarboxylase family protein [Clostridia bacterium]